MYDSGHENEMTHILQGLRLWVPILCIYVPDTINDDRNRSEERSPARGTEPAARHAPWFQAVVTVLPLQLP